MAEKIAPSHLASVGVIYRESDPSTIFIDIKDGGYPIKAFRWMMCPIGGNWIGESAVNDRNPYDTLCREINEELSLTKQTVSLEELKLLGIDSEEDSYVVPKNDILPTDEDHDCLAYLKQVFSKTAQPFGDFLVTVPKSVLDRGVQDNTRLGYSALFSYRVIPVNEQDWSRLAQLHEKFGNLSIESIAVIISLDEIIKIKRYTCCGHDLIMQRFFTETGCANASQYPLLDGISCERTGMPFDSYDQYCDQYDILRSPRKK